MTDLVPMTALGAETGREAHHGNLQISELSGLALASLAACTGVDLPKPFSLRLPEPGHMISGAGFFAFWTGPRQWMVAGENAGDRDFASQLKDQVPRCIVSEQTDGWVCLEVRSRAGIEPIEDLMIRLVNLAPTAFAPGRATRTSLHHMSVFVVRHGESRLSLIGMRSMAESLWHSLEETAKWLR